MDWDPLDGDGPEGPVAKSDFREVWLRLCREELAGAKERRLLHEATARHPSAQDLSLFDEPPERPRRSTVDVPVGDRL